MLYGIIMLYVLKIINAPIWCFILDWLCIILSALSIIFKIWFDKIRREMYEELLQDKK